MTAVIRWTHIEQLQHVRAWLVSRVELGLLPALPTLTFQAKVKLHGTNAGVQILPDGTVLAQGRNRVLAEGESDYGFLAWVQERSDQFATLAEPDHIVVVYGEWIGPGIQKKVAVTRLDRRVLAVFAVQRTPLEPDRPPDLLLEPDRIREILPEDADLFVLPWHGAPVRLDFGDRAGLDQVAEALGEAVEAIGRQDPWALETFGVDGFGEGLVLYPSADPGAGPWRPREDVTRLIFKAKSEHHKVTRADRTVQIDPEVLESIEAFADHFVTEPRLEQGRQEVFGEAWPTRDRTGEFLKWVGGDVRREGALDLEASGLTWKQVAKAVNQRAVRWLMERAI